MPSSGLGIPNNCNYLIEWVLNPILDYILSLCLLVFQSLCLFSFRCPAGWKLNLWVVSWSVCCWWPSGALHPLALTDPVAILGKEGARGWWAVCSEGLVGWWAGGRQSIRARGRWECSHGNAEPSPAVPREQAESIATLSTHLHSHSHQHTYIHICRKMARAHPIQQQQQQHLRRRATITHIAPVSNVQVKMQSLNDQISPLPLPPART